MYFLPRGSVGQVTGETLAHHFRLRWERNQDRIEDVCTIQLISRYFTSLISSTAFFVANDSPCRNRMYAPGQNLLSSNVLQISASKCSMGELDARSRSLFQSEKNSKLRDFFQSNPYKLLKLEVNLKIVSF
ncbi:hypothetical protein AVEN_201134-1 [Araneus ventricosus]|uniref:Uncharacterized protein n=1 Tax=Araneus ventricosus TaxID=182803 RepID=A0A4Y2IJ34_ARAVE|nr:hypothetical protein AVEN_201134-1 [Araneus ventricosus]